MSNVPCVEKFKQLVAAAQNLSVARCDMTAGGSISFGRKLSTSAWSHGANLTDIVMGTGPGGTDYLEATQSNPEYSCTSGTACYDGIWKATSPGQRRGCCRRALCEYYDHLDGDSHWALLLGTANPCPSHLSVSPSSCYTNPRAEDNVWYECIPVAGEFIIQKGYTPSVTLCGNYLDPISPATPHSINAGQGMLCYSLLDVLQSTGFPDVLAYLPEDATILGAIALVEFPSLQVVTYHADFAGTTAESPPASGCYPWTVSSSNAYIATEARGDVKMAALGQKNDGTVDVLAHATAPVANDVRADVGCWIDITGAIAAMHAAMNGPYKSDGVHFFAYGGTILHDLAGAAAGDNYLGRLRPDMGTITCTLRTNGTISAMSYNVTTATVQYGSPVFHRVYVAFQLPASAVTRNIGYYTWPDLS
jgi:hypothetical protein